VNEGLFGFPGRVGGTFNVQEFNQSGTYYIPSGANFVRIMAISGGGGGGGGRRGAAATIAGSGGGGSSGSMILQDFHVSEFNGATTLTVIIGAGGTGGAAATADSTNGSAGNAGGATEVRLGDSINKFMYVPPGQAGGAGTTAGGSGGTALSCIIFESTGSSGVSGGAGRTASFALPVSPSLQNGLCGGAGGGGVDAANVGYAGNNVNAKTLSGNIIGISNPNVSGAVATAGAVNSAAGPTQTPQYSTDNPSPFGPGFGGAGGGAGTTQAATNGGNGVRGGGGGGGGGSRNGFAAGAGGNGGNGYVCIWAWG